MKSFFIAMLLLSDFSTLTGVRMDASLDDPTAVVEPLTKDELSKLAAAHQVVEEAQAAEGRVEIAIKKAHGDTGSTSNLGEQTCSQPDWYQVDIRGKYALKVLRKGTSCIGR